ncbi:hypothetical protein BDFG_09406, partial [Blastomyces dermatitidis ATCC 26199]
LCSHNKHYHSTHIRQFVSKSSYIDRSVSVNDSESDIESLIENLKNIIMKKLSVLYVTESSASLSALSVSFSAASSQSSISASVSDSPAPAISVPVTPGFAIFAFIISSPCFKEMLHRLNELHFSVYILSLFLSTLRIIYCMKTNICVFKNRNVNIVLFYTHRCETFASVSEIILIKDDNVTKTIFSHLQASSVTFSLFSAEKV